MSQNANVWIVLSDTLYQQIKDILTDDEYSGPEEDLLNFLRHQIDWRTTFKLFKTQTILGEVRYLFNLSFNGRDSSLGQVKQAIDALSAIYGIDFSVAGSWWWDGSQGMDNSVSPAVPFYPINQSQLLKFMPDVWSEATSPGQYVAATVLTDVNLIQGQSPRDFS